MFAYKWIQQIKRIPDSLPMYAWNTICSKLLAALFEFHAHPDAYEFGHAGFDTAGVGYLQLMLEVLQQFLKFEDREQFLFLQMASFQC